MWRRVIASSLLAALVMSGCAERRMRDQGDEGAIDMMPASGMNFEVVASDGVEVHGAIYRPPGRNSERLPAVLFLHGRGECGTDGSHLSVGLPAEIVETPERWPFVVVMPQKPESNVEWEAYDAQVMTLLDIAVRDYGGDATRAAITGLSQGGHGTRSALSRRRLCAATSRRGTRMAGATRE